MSDRAKEMRRAIDDFEAAETNNTFVAAVDRLVALGERHRREEREYWQNWSPQGTGAQWHYDNGWLSCRGPELNI